MRRSPRRCSAWKVLIPLFIISLVQLYSELFGNDTNIKYDSHEKATDQRVHGQHVTKSHGENSTSGTHSNRPIINILYWNKFFKSNDFKFGVGQKPFIENNCPVKECSTTNDKALLAEADVVIFHGPQIDKLPQHRPAGQIYVYVQKEPWMEMSVKLMAGFDDTMNLTMTYREDSDIHLPYAIIKRNSSAARAQDRVDPKRRPFSVAWLVSHCDTPSQRELYVKELSKFVEVDTYGSCGQLSCDKRHNGACWAMLEEKYNFVLALENDICRDYVTEKAYRPFEYSLVPIVYGGANYTRVTPPHSVINVQDYPSPRQLAEYLRYLWKTPEAYNRYFAWKSQGYHIETYRRTIIGQAFCRLCQLLHDPSYVYKSYKQLKQWWVRGTCDRSLTTKLLT